MTEKNSLMAITADFIDEKFLWSTRTFGQHKNHMKIINHIRKEAIEASHAPTDPEEWVDMILLALDGLSRICGLSGAEIIEQIAAKNDKNHQREWPPVQEVHDDHPIEHVKSLPSVPDRLEALAKIYRERNAVYGDNYKHTGKVFTGLFPRGLTVTTEAEWNRLSLYVHIISKVTRYGQTMGRGEKGHADSLEDIAVYSIMTRETDDEDRQRK